MKERQQFNFGRKKIVVVSLFSGMDLFLLGMILSGMIPGFAVEKNIYAALMHAANYKNPDGTSVIEFINISEEEYIYRKKFKVKKTKPLEDTCIKTADGQFIRTKEISEVSGREIAESIERRFGKDVFVIVIGGPVCHDLTKLNTKRNLGEGSRNLLMKEYVRVVKELNEYGCASICIMEQVTDLGLEKHAEIYDDVVKAMLELPYRIAEADLCSLHMGGNQNRLRKYFFLINNNLNTDPVFPEQDDVNVKRVRDFLPHVEYFRPGQFNKNIKDKNDFMCTVTGSSPEAFYEDGKEFLPSIDNLLLCFDVEKGMYIIPDGIPHNQVRMAIGNAVCVSAAKAFAKIIIEKILCVKPDGDGYWVPIEDQPAEGDRAEAQTTVTEVVGEPSEQNDSSQLQLPVAVDETPSETTGIITEIPAELNNSAIEPLPPVQIPVSLPNVPVTVPTVSTFVTPKKNIISSLDLAAMSFMSLNFTGVWEQFIGCPTYNFNCIIHGKPGSGKSTLAIQFAKYLSDNFGRVVYISGEEGFSKTLQNKFMLTDSLSGDIDVADLRSYEDIIRNIATESYRFIFIDSLNTMKISVDELRELRNRYKGSAIITISQATKDGLIRGSNELVHDCDVHIVVEDGIAITPKNRFRNAGETAYSVFSENNIPGNHLEFTYENL
ncbi:MAG: DUF2075 domain-containing protein [Bacteroidetes bacterium]|nr:MAG: DUF2075 domain-containing protein [Bacteroidota bacterium]